MDFVKPDLDYILSNTDTHIHKKSVETEDIDCENLILAHDRQSVVVTKSTHTELQKSNVTCDVMCDVLCDVCLAGD